MLTLLIDQLHTFFCLYEYQQIVQLRGNFSTSAESGLDGTAATTASVGSFHNICDRSLVSSLKLY